MRIIQTPVRFYPYIGGVENHVYYLSDQLIKLGHEVSVICANEPFRHKIECIKSVQVQRLGYAFKFANTNIMLGLPWVLWRADFDIAHTHMPTPWTADWTVLITKLKKKRSVLTIHNDMDKPGLIGKIFTWIYLNTFFRLTIRLADSIIIVNPDWQTAFKKTSHLFKNVLEKVVTVPNGVDVEMFQPSLEKIQENTVLFVSILDKHHHFKGFEYLLDAVSKLKITIPNMSLVVIGEGELVKKYQADAERLGIEKIVKFEGKKTQTELAKYYQNARVFVLPSKEIEGFGIVLLEAMASGIPVVTTDIAGMASEIQKRQAGLVVHPRDSKQLAEAISEILTDPSKQDTMGINGRKLVVDSYSWSSVAVKILEIYKTL
jgi:glycosyltransferase involved in cell wall biosynthesis